MTEQAINHTLIHANIPAIFLHVKDVEEAAKWYSTVLQIPINPANFHHGHLYIFQMSNRIDFILDSKMYTPRENQLVQFMLNTADIDAAYKFLTENNVNIVREIERFPEVSFFSFKDPDHNVVMLCQKHS